MGAARVSVVAALGAGAVLAAGCGNDRQPTPDITTPGPPVGFQEATFAKSGVRFRAPGGWTVDAGPQLPLVVTVSTGTASLAVYRYARTEPEPKTASQLDTALKALIGAAKARDKTFTELKRAQLKVDGFPAVQLRGTETIGGQPRTVRSTHVYADKAEIVIDAFAPSAVFRRVDAQSFRPVLRSMRIFPPR